MKKRVAALTAVLAIILFASIGAVIYMNIMAENGTCAYIYQNDKLIRVVDLTDVEEPYTITIKSETGGENVLEVRQGSIGVVSATCPDRLCMNMGFISNSLIPVTCLPNHLVIKIEQKNGGSVEIDGVAY